MKIYVDSVEKPDVHPAHALCQMPRRPGKNGSLNRRGMSNNNKTYFRCGCVYSHIVKCPGKSKVCNNSKKVSHYAKCFRTKLPQKSDNHKDNGRQNQHPVQTLNIITHSPSGPKGHKSNFVADVYSDNDKYLFAVKDLRTKF